MLADPATVRYRWSDSAEIISWQYAGFVDSAGARDFFVKDENGSTAAMTYAPNKVESLCAEAKARAFMISALPQLLAVSRPMADIVDFILLATPQMPVARKASMEKTGTGCTCRHRESGGPLVNTPAPWKRADDGWIDGPTGPVVRYAAYGTHRAHWPNLDDYSLALAAPDLLAACRLTSGFLDALQGSEYAKDELAYEIRRSVYADLQSVLKRAIAKVEGQA